MSLLIRREWNLWDPDSLSVTFFPGELARLLLSHETNKHTIP